jgi:hypothetical protein
MAAVAVVAVIAVIAAVAREFANRIAKLEAQIKAARDE